MVCRPLWSRTTDQPSSWLRWWQAVHTRQRLVSSVGPWLAEDKTAAKDGHGADVALEHCHWAFDEAELEGPVGLGFCSSAGAYSGWDEDRLKGIRGGVEAVLRRTSAIDTLRASVDLKQEARWRAAGFVDLARALISPSNPKRHAPALPRRTHWPHAGLCNDSASRLEYQDVDAAKVEPTAVRARVGRAVADVGGPAGRVLAMHGSPKEVRWRVKTMQW
jgi:hypothetical protein